MSSPVAASETVVSINSQSSLGGGGLLQAVVVARAGQRVELVAAIRRGTYQVTSKALESARKHAGPSNDGRQTCVYIVLLSIEN